MEFYQAKAWYDAADLSKGLERIPVLVGRSDIAMTYFQYINSCLVYDQAHVPTTFQSLRPEDYCLCSRECFGGNGTCACQADSVGGVAYTKGGIVEDAFLYNHNEEDAHYCKKGRRCFNGESLCRGHVLRLFLKECSVKCRCYSDCGNRVVQQGMKFQVEVFPTALTGWGIRTTELIPRGAFFFELAVEILTNAEQMVRNVGVVGG